MKTATPHRSKRVRCGVKARGIIWVNTLVEYHTSSLARADVRVRVRPSVIRVRISETAMRAVIRVAAPKQQLVPLYLPVTPVGTRPVPFPLSVFRFP